MSSPILIGGGGIAGLVAALTLLRQGKPVVVLEQAKAVGDVGAGISMGRRTSRALYALGLEEAIREVADTPQGSAAFDYRSGEILGGAYARRNWSAADMVDVNMLHRADLFAVLKQAIEAFDPAALRLDSKVVRYEQDQNGVTVYLADGSTMHGTALIGADGLRSCVREQMCGASSPRKTGRVAYRFLVPMEQAAPFLSAGTAGIYVGSRVSFSRYVIRKSTLVNCLALVLQPEIEGESWSQHATRAELLALFDGWHDDVIGLAANAPLDRTARWALYDRDPLHVWTDGRVALLGDAAHPILPFLGMGAALGIEDAVILGRAMAQEPNPADAFQIYERARRDRANAILLESRQQGAIFDQGPGATNDIPATERESKVDYDPVSVALPVLDGAPAH
jgi:salicylate hydroxylase